MLLVGIVFVLCSLGEVRLTDIFVLNVQDLFIWIGYGKRLRKLS